MIWENLVATSKLIIEYDKIVVGSSLSATIFAFNNNYPLLFTEARRPFRFDYLPSGIDLSFLKIPPSSVDLSTFGERKKVGIAKEILWERLVFLLSLDSKIPLSSLANSAREDGDGQITFFNDYSKIAKIKFNTCYYFGDKGTRGLVKEKTLASKKYICYDWIAFNRGGKHDTDYIKTDDDLVKEEQLRDFNYSETMARFKLVHEMESRGMKGKFNGYGTNGKPKHYKFRTTSTYREKSERGNEYEPQSAYVESPTHCEESLLQGLQEASLDYGRFLKYL